MAQNDQPGPAYCTFKEQRGKVKYRCIREEHTDNAHTLKREDELSDALKTYFAKTTLDDLTDRGDLVTADPPTAVMQTMAELAELVGLAEIDRKFDLLSYQTKALISIAAEIRIAKLCLADDRPVEPEVMERIKKHVDAWVLQVGIREDGGS